MKTLCGSGDLTRLFNSNDGRNRWKSGKKSSRNSSKSTGENVHVGQTFPCDYGCHISVGENFYANYELALWWMSVK